MAHRLNRRFREGRPSGDLASAGVLIHQFDGILFGADAQWPWQSAQRPWQSRAFFSAYLANKCLPPLATGALPLFSDTTAGVVLAPTARVLCAYHTDGMRFAQQKWNLPLRALKSSSTVSRVSQRVPTMLTRRERLR